MKSYSVIQRLAAFPEVIALAERALLEAEEWTRAASFAKTLGANTHGRPDGERVCRACIRLPALLEGPSLLLSASKRSVPRVRPHAPAGNRHRPLGRVLAMIGIRIIAGAGSGDGRPGEMSGIRGVSSPPFPLWIGPPP